MGLSQEARRQAAGTAQRGDWRSAIGRAGLVAKAVLYVSLGILALQFVYGTTSAQETSTTGAIEQVARQPFGQFLLIVLTIGLAALVVWNVLRAITGDPVEGAETSDKLKYAAKAAVYAGITATSAGILGANWGESSSSGGGGGGGSSQQQATAVVFDWPAGRWLVGLAGLAVIGYAIAVFYKHAIEEEFLQRLDHAKMDGNVEAAVEGIGRGGYAARSIVFAIIGVLLVVAAVQHDASEAGGLSEALQSLSGSTWGQVLLWVIAVGLVFYGLFALAEARYRRAV